MNKLILFPAFLSLLLVLTACQPTETVPETPPDPTAITAEQEQIAKDLVQGAFDDLWGGVDSTKMSLYHTDDFLLLEHGEVWDNDRIKEYMRSQLNFPDRALRINRMEYMSIDKYGPSMQIMYWNYADFTQNDSLVGKMRWLESALAVETDAGWRLKMMHSTRSPE